MRNVPGSYHEGRHPNDVCTYSKNLKIVDIEVYGKINSGLVGGGLEIGNAPCCHDALPPCILNAPEMLQMLSVVGGKGYL